MQNHATLTVTTAEAARLLGISRNVAYEAARPCAGSSSTRRRRAWGKSSTVFLRDAGTRLSPSTAHRYAELWRLHAAPRLGSIPVGRLRAAHIAVLYADQLLIRHSPVGRALCPQPRHGALSLAAAVLTSTPEAE